MNPVTRFRYETTAYNRLASKVATPDLVGLDSAERHHLVEALVVKICTEWEVFTENLLIECLRKDTSKYAESKDMSLPKTLPRDLGELLLTGIGFFGSRSVGGLKGMANDILLDQHNPFKEIKPPHSTKIDEFFAIRNYIAHRSRSSKLKLNKIYLGTTYGLQRFVEPGEFLLTPNGSHAPDGATRLQAYFDAFFTAVDIIDDFLS